MQYNFRPYYYVCWYIEEEEEEEAGERVVVDMIRNPGWEELESVT